jgi:hypothetical protein
LDHKETKAEQLQEEVLVAVNPPEPEVIEVNPVSDVWCQIRTGEDCPRYDVRTYEEPATIEDVYEIVWSTIWETNDEAIDMTYVFLLVFYLGFHVYAVATFGFLLATFADKFVPYCCGCFSNLLHYFGWMLFVLAFFPANCAWVIFASLIRHSANGNIVSQDRGLLDTMREFYQDSEFMIAAMQED